MFNYPFFSIALRPHTVLDYKMISRRNIRVKVMQTLYALETMEPGTIKPGTATSLLNEKLDQTSQIFTYLLYCLTQVAQYAEIDAQQRASKHLPSAEDLTVNTKIAGNEFIFQIINDKGFQVNLETWKLKTLPEQDMLRKLYHILVASDIYQEYIKEP